MAIQIVGDSPLLSRGPALFRKGLGTIFPAWDTLVTVPGIHASQRLAFVEYLNAQRTKAGQPLLTPGEEDEAWAKSVDLFFENDTILIRPDPDNMPLAFEADELLQALVSKQKIRFLQATNERVRHAIRERGEYWRICPLPKSRAEIQQMISGSKTQIGGEPIYYHNRLTGSRFLTVDAFFGLGRLPAAYLAQHLREIQEYSLLKNQLQQPEICFFQASSFGTQNLANIPFLSLDAVALRAKYESLKAEFLAAVPEELRHDDVDDPTWRYAMFNALVGQQNEKVAEEILRGLSSEYFMQVEWLPGCRIENGELLFDSIFYEHEKNPDRADLAAVCDPRTKSFIFNFTREYGELEYVNVARLPSSLSRRTQSIGRRGVYLAEIKPREHPEALVCIIRMQKWDVTGHLDKGKDLLGAMLEAAEYSDYVLDRRLACRQVGMNLPAHIMMYRLSEVYRGLNERYTGQVIWSTYFERDYFAGVATDKISPAKLENEAYAFRFAQLLGQAAAHNMVVGRLDASYRVLFDDGDEIVREQNGLPSEILIADPTGAFGDYLNPLEYYAKEYAQPIVKRWRWLKNPAAFVEAYVGALETEFQSIQAEYRKRRRAFDSLFLHRTRNTMGSFAYRWEKVLDRLDRTDPKALTASLRANALATLEQPGLSSARQTA